MITQLSFRQLVESYQDAEGNNPFSSAFSLMSLSTAIPAQIAKAAGLSLAFYVGMLVLLVLSSASGITVFLAVVAGFFLGVYLSITGSVKLISDLVLDQVSKLVKGIAVPINQLYGEYRKKSGGTLSQQEFTICVFKEAVIPILLARIPAVPFKDRLNTNLYGLVNNVEKALLEVAPEEKNLTGESGQGIRTQGNYNGDTYFLNKFIQTAETEVEALKNRTGASFHSARRIALIGWGMIWLTHFVF